MTGLARHRIPEVGRGWRKTDMWQVALERAGLETSLINVVGRDSPCASILLDL